MWTSDASACFEVDVRGEELDVDEDHLGGVGRLLHGLGDDDGDGLTDETHLAAREQGAARCRIEGRRNRLEAEGLSGVDRDDAGHSDRAVGVDRFDRAVRDCGADEGDLRRSDKPWILQVVCVDAACRQELRVFLALDARPQNACSSHGGTPCMS